VSQEQTPLGHIDISPSAIASIAAQAVAQSYGVVGLTGRNFANGVARTLSGDPNRGVEVRITDGRIEIDMYVIIEYGTRIKQVAASVQNQVRFNVEKSLGRPVAAVNVHVQGLRVSNPDA
jgi:uncharacterized alkaline shock family protein YloU